MKETQQGLIAKFSPPPINAEQLLINICQKHISPVSIGKSEVPPNTSSPIVSLNCNLLYYSACGSGTLKMNDVYYPIAEGDFFIVPVGANASIRSDFHANWTFRWLGFVGTLSQDFLNFPTIFTLPSHIIPRLYLCSMEDGERNLASRLTSDLYLIHSIMQNEEEHETDYVQRVINIINASYSGKISVAQISKDLNLNRSHLSRLFKNRMNMSIQDYIQHFRIAEAKRYLKHGYSVSDTAQLCGFSDRANFYKYFFHETGKSPTDWAKMVKSQPHTRPR